jgi:hypothetical protein
MRTRLATIVLTLVLVAFILTLTPLAHADPPDPTWISGIWDYDDFDDVVGYITSAAGLLPNPVVCDRRPVALPALLSPLEFEAAVSALRSASSPRAPPDLPVQSPPLSRV